ncbi:winged helix-turn-helix domain-containing protein [Sphingomonas desiccabilis]|uniref:OmpR/PhoB-type domain-containing protein n=1 Tax=Sphingomonas desiccabilis TaxID=429134 RepID=A0A4Q2IR00_9SPHN|nr:winged helix-turn-helix domain-containing protein [Sphingomonas desiccabilis]RXZ30266.1 hypothetical protein EO081_13740 [Sphingomonas desiccabilis]
MSGTMFELLMVLLKRPGELLSQQELMRHVWPGRTIDSSNVRSQVAVLRRTLGCSKRGEQYIATSSGRGYRFAAPVQFGTTEATASAERSPEAPPGTNQLRLAAPWCATAVIGRDAEIAEVVERIGEHRQVTIVGQAGGGKTAVALAAASAAHRFDAAHWFAPDEDCPATRFEEALVTAIDPNLCAANAREALVALAGERALLLVIDGADRHLDAAAAFAEWLLTALPRCALLMTSCEAMGGAFEDVLRLPPLALPNEAGGDDAVLGSPAVALLRARLGRIPCEATPPELADLAHRTGGNPLAIELVAAEARTIGVGALLDILDDALLLSLQRRSGPLRQRSLGVLMEAAFAGLEQAERQLLARLSTLPDTFALEPAAEAALCSPRAVATQFRLLVGRSLVEICPADNGMRYRLPAPVRAYAARWVARPAATEPPLAVPTLRSAPKALRSTRRHGAPVAQPL